MFEGCEALVVFEHGSTYLVETEDGYARGVWDGVNSVFYVRNADGSVRPMQPSFLDPDSGLVAWKKLED